MLSVKPKLVVLEGVVNLLIMIVPVSSIAAAGDTIIPGNMKADTSSSATVADSMFLIVFLLQGPAFL